MLVLISANLHLHPSVPDSILPVLRKTVFRLNEQSILSVFESEFPEFTLIQLLLYLFGYVLQIFSSFLTLAGY